MRQKINSIVTSDRTGNILIAIPENLTSEDAQNFIYLLGNDLDQFPKSVKGADFIFVFGDREKLKSDEDYVESFVQKCTKLDNFSLELI